MSTPKFLGGAVRDKVRQWMCLIADLVDETVARISDDSCQEQRVIPDDPQYPCADYGKFPGVKGPINVLQKRALARFYVVQNMLGVCKYSGEDRHWNYQRFVGGRPQGSAQPSGNDGMRNRSQLNSPGADEHG